MDNIIKLFIVNAHLLGKFVTKNTHLRLINYRGLGSNNDILNNLLYLILMLY